MTVRPCPICAASMHEAFRATVLHRHAAIYDHCGTCGFLRARAPFWLDEAYADAISITDTGLLLRNRVIARQLSALFAVLDVGTAPVLDYAGGYGVLTRMMRDNGYDFYWSDPYCRNLLAPGFEHHAGVGACRAVTAFEVLEHVEDPKTFVGDALAAGGADTLVFTTELYAGYPPAPGDWWYYSFETGQHIAFYRRDTLERLAHSLGMNFHTRRGLHIFSRRALPARAIDFVLGPLNPIIATVARKLRTTKTGTDHDAMVKRLDTLAMARRLDADRV